MSKLTKKELVLQVAKTSGNSRKDTEKVVNAMFTNIEEALRKGDTVSLFGFGTFTTYERTEREGRNPMTGKNITIPSTTVCKFKPSKVLRKAVNR